MYYKRKKVTHIENFFVTKQAKFDIYLQKQRFLELIPKLAMNLDHLTPDNNRASKMDQSEIVLSFLFKANKQLAKAVKKGMSDFDHPAPGLEVRIALYFFAFFASGTDMGSVLAFLNGLGTACITSIQTKILWLAFTDSQAGNDTVIQCFFQELDVMCVCSRKDNGQRKSFFIG